MSVNIGLERSWLSRKLKTIESYLKLNNLTIASQTAFAIADHF